ncbi:cytoskeleton protein RodZ [Vibrio hannami]|uniref:cytoskeleton protein RodZ n=1 Tax=Vibrio hannami TaxID=2717094 RepID=UPI002410AA44|nr:cytoskeleton protein RodZ [Vibrio hannami]MDG3087238.1 cytoskeleton protein RodZ [Vibrio hannami]
MSTENETVTPQEEAVVVKAGDLLRTKREELGISQKDIADRLRLRVAIIESIDNNVFEFDHVATFTRGYLRSYAKAVGLDEKEVLAALDGAEEAQHSPQSMQSFSRKTKREKHDSRITSLSWVIFAVIIGISAVWWYQNQQDTLDEATLLDDQQPVVSVEETVAEVETFAEPSTVIEQAEEPIQEADAAVSQEPSEPVAIEETQTEEVAQEQDVQPAEESAADEVTVIEITEEVQEPVAVANTLVMNFSADCWVQVKDADGKTLVTGVKKAGQNLNVAGTLPYSVVLGAPEGVKMTLASEPVDLSGYTSGKVARFTLP